MTTISLDNSSTTPRPASPEYIAHMCRALALLTVADWPIARAGADDARVDKQTRGREDRQ